eukprot:ANDGO_03444.mRNA.1 hypothetical protein
MNQLRNLQPRNSPLLLHIGKLSIPVSVHFGAQLQQIPPCPRSAGRLQSVRYMGSTPIQTPTPTALPAVPPVVTPRGTRPPLSPFIDAFLRTTLSKFRPPSVACQYVVVVACDIRKPTTDWAPNNQFSFALVTDGPDVPFHVSLQSLSREDISPDTIVPLLVGGFLSSSGFVNAGLVAVNLGDPDIDNQPPMQIRRLCCALGTIPRSDYVQPAFKALPMLFLWPAGDPSANLASEAARLYLDLMKPLWGAVSLGASALQKGCLMRLRDDFGVSLDHVHIIAHSLGVRLTMTAAGNRVGLNLGPGEYIGSLHAANGYCTQNVIRASSVQPASSASAALMSPFLPLLNGSLSFASIYVYYDPKDAVLLKFWPPQLPQPSVSADAASWAEAAKALGQNFLTSVVNSAASVFWLDDCIGRSGPTADVLPNVRDFLYLPSVFSDKHGHVLLLTEDERAWHKLRKRIGIAAAKTTQETRRNQLTAWLADIPELPVTHALNPYMSPEMQTVEADIVREAQAGSPAAVQPERDRF